MKPLRSLILAAAIVGPANRLIGQEARVQVVNKATGAGIPGALISLRNEANAVVLRVLADERGRAVLRALAAGRYQVRADGIGFSMDLSSPLDLDPSTPVSVRLALEPAPLKLDEVIVTGTRSVVCDLSQAEGGTVARIWDEARKALTATTLTRANKSLEFEIRLIDRQLRPSGRIISEKVDVKRGASQRPFQTADPELLHQNGYVLTDESGSTYFGADADLLLSDRFLDDHCFGLADKAPAGKIGLTFAPIESRKVSDIRGTLWLDQTSLQLGLLEFAFTRVDYPDGVENVGGRVEFNRLPSGAWIVSNWAIRMPVIAQVKGAITNRTELRGYREAAGQALASGSRAPLATTTAIAGTVFDSVVNAPLGNAVVSIQSGAFADTSDQEGRFRIETPGVGNYAVTLRHPRLHRLGLDSLLGSARVVRGETTTLNFAVPGPAAVGTELCQDPGRVVVGLLRDAGTTLPIAGVVTILFPARVIRRHPRPRSGAPTRVAIGERGTNLTSPTDSSGAFQFCGIPFDSEVTLLARVPSRLAVTRLIEAGSTALVELEVPIP